MEERMTVEDAWLLSVFSTMKETRNDRLLQCAFGIGYGKWMAKREPFSTVQMGESPRWWVEFDGKYHSEGPAFIQSILDRVGDHDLENRAQAVIHNATVEFWGGEEEYQKTWGWMKNHSDLESVDNTCIECGCRGLATYEHTCGSCRAAWIESH